MPPVLTKTFTRVKETVGGFSIAQRTIAIIGVAVLALGVVALSSWLSKPALTPLFSGLNAKDASAVVEQLNSAGVSYELADGGSTVMVAQADVYEQRLAAAANGLPSGDSNGYTLLDSMGVTSSEFQQSVTYKRAIEGELANTISAMDGVRAASVQLAIPEESVFVSEQKEPTASVFVETTSRSLTTDQVEAIIHLVSASVSGMKPESVAVIDQEGKTLSTVGAGASGGTEKQASEYETRVAANIQKILDTVVGTGNATVTVAADMNKSTSERLEETYTPAEGVPPASEQSTRETYTGNRGEAGVLGTQNIVGANGDGQYENTSETRNNLANKTTESINTPAGTLTRQTVSVAVNREAAQEMNVEQIEALVASAAGINADRGDEVTVEVVPFSAGAADAAEKALEEARRQAEAEQMNELIRTGIIAGAVLIVAVVAFLFFRRRKKTTTTIEEILEVAEPADEADTTNTAQEAPTDAFTAVMQGVTAPAIQFTPADLGEVPEPEEPESTQKLLDVRRAELGDLARRDPARTADLLRRVIRDHA